MPLSTGGGSRPPIGLTHQQLMIWLYANWPWRAATGLKLLTADELGAGIITADLITVTQLSAISANMGTITAGTITGGTVRTAASGARVVMDTGGITAYDGSGNDLFSVSATTGQMMMKTAETGGRVEIDGTYGIRIFTSTGMVGQFSDAGIAISGSGTSFSIKSGTSGARIEIDGANGVRAYNGSGQVCEMGTDGYFKTNIIRTLSDATINFANTDESFKMQMILAGGSITLQPYGYATTVGMIVAAVGSLGHVTLKYNTSTTILDAYDDYVDIYGNCQLSSGKVYKINNTQVVGAQGAAVADATDAATAITQLNTLLARCRAHGLIAT